MQDARDDLDLDDRALLRRCQVHTYRASGPGGQKRNKTDSAVRLRHRATGLTVVATESRSQHENRARAVRRMREAIALHIRRPLDPETFQPPKWFASCLDGSGRLRITRRCRYYYHAVGLVLDVLDGAAGSVADAARRLGMTTSKLVAFLQSDEKLWTQANAVRRRFGREALIGTCRRKRGRQGRAAGR